MDFTEEIIISLLQTITSILVTIGYIKGRLDGIESQLKNTQQQLNLVFSKMINGKRGDNR